MARPQVRLQTESKTNRRFITIRNERNGTTSYPKVYLRTKNEEVARRRLIALDGVDDVEEARRRIDRLASAISPEQEMSRLADFLHRGSPAPYIPVMTIEEARKELYDMFGDFDDEERPTEEQLDRWRRASTPEGWQPILIELGADDMFLLDPHCYEGLTPSSMSSGSHRGRFGIGMSLRSMVTTSAMAWSAAMKPSGAVSACRR